MQPLYVKWYSHDRARSWAADQLYDAALHHSGIAHCKPTSDTITAVETTVALVSVARSCSGLATHASRGAAVLWIHCNSYVEGLVYPDRCTGASATHQPWLCRLYCIWEVLSVEDCGEFEWDSAYMAPRIVRTFKHVCMQTRLNTVLS